MPNSTPHSPSFLPDLVKNLHQVRQAVLMEKEGFAGSLMRLMRAGKLGFASASKILSGNAGFRALGPQAQSKLWNPSVYKQLASNVPRGGVGARQSQTSLRNIRDVMQSTPTQQPWQMTGPQFRRNWKDLSSYAQKSEGLGRLDMARPNYKAMTSAEKLLHSKNWKQFSRGRGFTEPQIAKYDLWRQLSGQTANLRGAVNDPWRRTSLPGPMKMWQQHIQKATSQGHAIPPDVLRSLAKAPKPRGVPLPRPTPPLPGPSPLNQTVGDINVW
jgi:hypothetical protein